jgi:hypothetical protein
MPTGTLSALVFGVIAGVQERALRHGQSDPIGPAGLPESTAAKQFIFTAIAKASCSIPSATRYRYVLSQNFMHFNITG